MQPLTYISVSIINGGRIITHSQSRNLFGLLLVIVGVLLILNNFDVDIFRYFWPGLIIAVGVYLIYRSMRKQAGADSDFSECRMFGDSSFEEFSGEIGGTDISHFIGDTSLNLTKAELKSGVNSLGISSFIGDIEVIVPEGMAVDVHCSSAIGDLIILNRKHGSLFASATEKTAGYDSADKKLRINCNSFIGDIKIRKFESAAN